jgi:hypothetical protein
LTIASAGWAEKDATDAVAAALGAEMARIIAQPI